MPIVAALAALAVPVGSLSPLPGNPRRGDVQAVARSLERFGQRKPIVVRSSDRVIVAGNHTWLAAKELGWTEIAITLVDDDEATAKAYALADNRTAELGSYDDAELLALIDEVRGVDPELLHDAGWADEAVAELLRKLGDGLPDVPPPDEAPEPPTDPVSKVGDVWVLGGHRVICGDSTDLAVLEALMASELVDCVWTDPPYGVDYQGNVSLSEAAKQRRRTDGNLTVKNDKPADVPALLAGAFAAVTVVVKPGAAIYVAHPAGRNALPFEHAFVDAGWRLHQTLIWDKGRIVLGHSDYHYQHEPILFGYTPCGGRRGRGGTGWFGDHTQGSILQVPKPQASPEHPTMKPVELIVRCLNNSAPRGGLVLDPFGGSGSTLMACDYTGRRARLVELDPRYVDVICRRWQTHTGGKPVLEATGEPHDFSAEATDATTAEA